MYYGSAKKVTHFTMFQALEKQIKKTAQKVYKADVDNVFLEHPENHDFGDLATNLPLTLASELKQPPMEIAKNIAYELKESELTFIHEGKKQPIFKKIETASPGFINFTFSTKWLQHVLYMVSQSKKPYGIEEKYKADKIIVEYTDPNPFKMFHIGHAMTNAIGESLSRIFEALGAEVKRANYQGDVGVHVAKSIWGLQQKLADEEKKIESLEELPLKERIFYIGSAYALGNRKYEEDKEVKMKIDRLNRVIYYISQKHNEKIYDWQPVIDYEELISDIKDEYDLDLLGRMYELGRLWSLDYFETIYHRLGTDFDLYYFESMIAEEGLKLVQKYKKVFEESDGAIVFRGEEYGLHTRVFINSLGLPVYEAKDLGLALVKHSDFPYDRSIIITGNDIVEYFKVVLKALEQFKPDLAAKTTHIGHGMLRLKTGKMSSRTGDVISGDELLDRIKETVLARMQESETTQVERKEKEAVADKIAVAALKYGILKNGIGNNIVYDEEQAVGIQGNTGPYLLYTYTRTNSVFEKAGLTPNEVSQLKYDLNGDLEPLEDELLRHIYKFSEEISLAAERLAPNLIAGFIYEIAQKYNALYAELPIIEAESTDKTNLRLHLTLSVHVVLEQGLHLLGIEVVDKM